MKNFTRIEPTTHQEIGDRFKNTAVIKRYRTEDGMEHEFTTMNQEGLQSAAVIALTHDNEVVISRQFRAGRERYVDDLPGGKLEKDENPEQGVRRELLEETGYEVGVIDYLGQWSWDAYSNLTSHYFLATNCSKHEKHVHEQVEIDQGLETILISIDQLIENAKTNNMTDAVAVLMAYDKLLKIKEKRYAKTN